MNACPTESFRRGLRRKNDAMKILAVKKMFKNHPCFITTTVYNFSHFIFSAQSLTFARLQKAIHYAKRQFHYISTYYRLWPNHYRSGLRI